MTTALLNATDRLLRDRVMQQLEWDSQVDASAVGVMAKDGVVTLTGYIDTYGAKLAAERAAKRVRGVRAVANETQVRLRLDHTDTDIAADAVRALRLRATLPDTIQVVVHNGHITLTGAVETLFQRAIAERAVRHIRGLKGIVNRTVVTPSATSKDIKRHIAAALQREADVDANGIEVTFNDGTVLLKGTVRSWHERESAERAAMHSRGITQVVNLLEIASDENTPGDELC